MIEISAANARDYLRDRGLISDEPVRIEELGGGISNVVLRVETGPDCFVLKQSLPKLRVAADWPFDRRRILGERTCMKILGEMLPPGTVPEVRFHDDENFIFTMSCAPRDAVLWKQVLMAGEVDRAVAVEAAQLLAVIHNATSQDPATLTRFADPRIFIEGRVDPYHWTAAAAHPDLASVIRAETDRLLATRLVLVHGDYSPKNMFVRREGVPRLFLLDFEVAHKGDPAFDAAFCLTHLVLKAIRFPNRGEIYFAAAIDFWNAYRTALLPHLAHGIERHTSRELGCILLARVDGKSKIEYLTEETAENAARRVAREILRDQELTVAGALHLASDVVRTIDRDEEPLSAVNLWNNQVPAV